MFVAEWGRCHFNGGKRCHELIEPTQVAFAGAVGLILGRIIPRREEDQMVADEHAVALRQRPPD
jgi:hypothetical protein